jgi:hypothetical protein
MEVTPSRQRAVMSSYSRSSAVSRAAMICWSPPRAVARRVPGHRDAAVGTRGHPLPPRRCKSQRPAPVAPGDHRPRQGPQDPDRQDQSRRRRISRNETIALIATTRDPPIGAVSGGRQMRPTPRAELALRGFVAGMVLIVRVTINRGTGEPGSQRDRRHLLTHARILVRSRRHKAPLCGQLCPEGEYRDVGRSASCERGERGG